MNPLPWLFSVAGLVSLDARLINPVLPAIAIALGATPGEVGWSATAYTLTYGAFQLVWGPLGDRWGRIRVLRLNALLFAGATAVGGLATTVAGFVAARLVTGMFAAATIPTAFAYVGDTVRYERRLRTLGRFQAMMSGAQAVSAAVAGAVTYVISWRVMFVGFGVVTALAALPLFRVPAAPGLARTDTLSYAAILARAAARRVYLAAFGEGLFVWGGATYLGVLASQRLGFNDLQVGVLLAAYGVGMVAGGVTASRLCDAVGERTAAAVGGLAQGLAWLFLLPPLGWPVFALSLATMGIGWSWLHTTLQMQATEVAPEARGKAFSLFPLSFFMGGSVGAALIGQLIDAGWTPAAIVFCGVGLAVVGLYAARRR